LYEAGYKVTVFYSYWTSWADQPDRELKKKHPGIDWIRIGGHPEEERFEYLFSRISFKFFRSLIKFWPNVFLKKNALNRTSYRLLKKLSSVKADMYIAHGLGVLPAVIRAAKKNKAKAGIDFEDHYSGQWETNSKEYKLYKWVEDNCIPGISYATAASSLIAEKYKQDYPSLSPVVINNVFSKAFLQPALTEYKGGKLKLFWFSQTVGKGRGIEELIRALGKLDGDISCTILGSCGIQEKNELLQYAKKNGLEEGQIIFSEPVSPDKIFAIAGEHHIGLALETEESLNRNICLTNKIFTYLLSGLAVLATDTLAQKQFLQSHPGIGNFYTKGNANELAGLIRGYKNNPVLLQLHRSNALALAAGELNWEQEQKKFLTLIELQFS
jgi:glycosyltransferase involved in cell wall biosynthesis